MRKIWRVAFIASGVLIAWGGSMHPGGTMEEMLSDPTWLPGHMLVCGGFVAFAVGLWTLRSRTPKAMRRIADVALGATALQAIEMLVHAMAYVDLEHLKAGQPTPVLTTHLALTTLVYPLFGIVMSVYILAAARHKVVGSPWIAWLGVIGVVAPGIAGLLVPFFNVGWARPLFPGIVLFALWAILAGVWRMALARAAPAGV
jgi:hypothetical protein